MRSIDARLHDKGTFLLLAFGTLLVTTAQAGTNVWTKVGSPGDVWIHALAINPATPSTLYAGTSPGGATGGLLTSTDSARTWTVVKGIPNNDVYAIVIDPATPTTIYAGGFEGVFKSTDSGDKWTATAAKFGTVTTLAIDPTRPSTLYAGCRQDIMSNGGIFKSTDAGLSWIPSSSGLTTLDIRTIAVSPDVPSTLYAGTSYEGVFKSTNSGDTWTSANAGLMNYSIYSFAIDPVTPSTIYAGTFRGVFKSTDAGDTWFSANAGLPFTGSSLFGNVDSLVINSTNPSTLYAGNYFNGIFKTSNGGETWSSMNAGFGGGILAIDPVTPSRIYAGTFFGEVFVYEPVNTGFVPIVLDVMGLAHYTSELQLTNLGDSSTTVTLSYTSSMGSGSGATQETVPAGQQVVFPDAIAYLRSQGVPIPASGNQGGTVLLSAPAAGVHATVRTCADTVDPQPVGRAGLAYTEIDPASSSATKLYVYGLRTNDADRSNLAVYNMGGDSVSLKVTLVSGDDGSSFEVTAGVPRVLPAYGWYQYGDGLLLRAAGFSSGYAIIERVSGSGPFGAYGVVNDQKTNDGSFIPALSGMQSGSRLTLPVLVETGTFESELILANRGSYTATFTLRYVESLSPAKGVGGTTTVELAAGRQQIIPHAIDFLRSKDVGIGARGEASYAGSLQIQVSGVGLESVFAGARTSAPSPAGGEYGLFYPAIDSSQEASDSVFILGLKADMNNRSNVAVVHTGVDWSGPITLELQVLDGSEGGQAAGQPLSVTLSPGQWAQPGRFFADANVPNGYVRIRRISGTAPWYAYGVINDGGQPTQRTGDGAYVPGVQP